MHPARSLVILPASTTSTQAFSNANANLAKSGVLSNFARCSRPDGQHQLFVCLLIVKKKVLPRVHAKIDATGLVEVDCPFWCCLKKKR